MNRYKSKMSMAAPRRLRSKNIDATESRPYTSEELAARRANAKQIVVG